VLGLAIVRHYNSAFSTPASRAGALGRGWRLGYDTSLDVGRANRLTLLHADGALVHFARGIVESTRFVASDAAHGSITVRASGATREYLWTRSDAQQWSFDAAGRLTQVKAPSGEFVSLTHDAQGALVRVIDPQGRSLQLNYAATATGQRLHSIDCRRRLNFDPPCRPNSDPGMEAGNACAGCGQV
jgi:YD repeat-containing protein